MEISKYTACICEGTAEQVIIDILLDSGKLIFSRENLLEEEVIRCRSGRKFEEMYLRKGFTEKITVYRILDSHRERFNISKAYEHKINVINVVTAPEIEMLVIFAEGKYAQYKSSHKKPSEFCTQDLHYRDVKSRNFVKSYFTDVNVLIEAIAEYKRVTNIKNNEYSLADLLR